MKSLVARVFARERRRASRRVVAHLAAYYWGSSHAAPPSVRDISDTGLYVVTEDRWHPGTLLMVTLQTSATKAGPLGSLSIRVHCRVARAGNDGVGLTFLFPLAESASDQGATRKEFSRFSKLLPGVACIALK